MSGVPHFRQTRFDILIKHSSPDKLPTYIIIYYRYLSDLSVKRLTLTTIGLFSQHQFVNKILTIKKHFATALARLQNALEMLPYGEVLAIFQQTYQARSVSESNTLLYKQSVVLILHWMENHEERVRSKYPVPY